MSAIQPTYVYGSRVDVPYEWEDLPIVQALTSASAQFAMCHECATYGEAESIALFSIGGIGNDILDDSNESALAEIAESWKPWVYVHSGVGTTVCVQPTDSEDMPAEILDDIIYTAERFADYPVLDESDYSEREWNAWQESLESELNRASGDVELSDSDRARIAEWVTEGYYGYSDPGWVSPDWIIEAAQDLSIDLGE